MVPEPTRTASRVGVQGIIRNSTSPNQERVLGFVVCIFFAEKQMGVEWHIAHNKS